jgi:hypothetical protein
MVNTQDLDNTTAPTGDTQTFNVSTTNRFSYYRMVINQVYSSSVAEIGFWNLYGQYDAVLPITFNATVSNGVYSLQQLTPTIENVQVQPFIQFEQGKTYIINYPTAHPLALSETKNGTWASGTPYTTGITNDTTNGKLTLVMSEYKTLYYYCTFHSGMGYNPSTDFSANFVNTSCILSNYVNSVTMCCSKDAKIVWIFNVNNFGLYMSTNYGYTFRSIPFSTTLINTANSSPSQMCCDDTGFIMYMTYNKTTTYKFNKATYTMDSVAYMTNTMAVAITGDGNTLYGLNPTGNKLKKYIVSTSTDLSYNTNYTTNTDAPFSFTMDSTGTYLAACGDATSSSSASILMTSNDGGLTWSSPVISTNPSGTAAYFGCAKYNYTGTVLCVSYGGASTSQGQIFISYDHGLTFTNLNTLNVFNCLGNNGRTGGPAIHIDANGTNFIFMDQTTIVQYNKTTNTSTSLNTVLGNTGSSGGLVCGDIYGTRFVFSYSDGSQTYFKTMERLNIYNPNNNFNSIASTAKFYYSGDYGVVKSTSNNNITTWKNRIAGGVDASANTTNAGGYYPTHVSTYSGATFNSNMIQFNNGNNNYIGFNSAGGAKLASEPVEQTFVIFGYFSGTNADNQIMSKIGLYSSGSNIEGTLHIMVNSQNTIVVINGDTYYQSSLSQLVTAGYIMICITAIMNVASTQTILNVNAYYPNYTVTTNTTTINNTLRASDLHGFELGYWSSGRSFRGTIGEVMYFNRKLTDKERFILEGKLAWKYGKASILPASHPYKTVAPA